MTEKIWDSVFPLAVYFESEELLILVTCASWPNIERVFDAALESKRRIHFITMDWGWTYRESVDHWRKFLPYRDIVSFLSNDLMTYEARCEAGLITSLVNHNAWINEEVFFCSSEQKQYDAVLTSRAKKWKRIGLSRKVDNLALVVNRWNIDSHYGENDGSYLEMSVAYLNSRKLSKNELSELYCKSRVGMILSGAEGACYTSSEYLLCGIPVVSTVPDDGVGLGGREFWYTNYNSILCTPDENAVRDAVYELIEKAPDSRIIREQHVELMKAQRERFLQEVLSPIFLEVDRGFDTRSYFYDTLFDLNTKECRLKSEGKVVPYYKIKEISCLTSNVDDLA